MILTFIKMNVRPEKRKELRQTIRSIVQEVRKENGCADSTFYQNSENENDFFLFEEWENRQVLDDHLRSARFTVLMGARSLLSRPPEIMIHSVSHSSGLEAGSHKT
ncbi:MAG: putative quinol monooxygenase [Desulfobacterales bacterium]